MAKVNLHDLVRKYEAAYDKELNRAAESSGACFSNYLFKTALAYVAAEYAARGEFDVDAGEFRNECSYLAYWMSMHRGLRPRRGKPDKGGVKRPVPHNVATCLRMFTIAGGDGDPIH
jgi:hypothetical protein